MPVQLIPPHPYLIHMENLWNLIITNNTSHISCIHFHGKASEKDKDLISHTTTLEFALSCATKMTNKCAPVPVNISEANPRNRYVWIDIGNEPTKDYEIYIPLMVSAGESVTDLQ